MSRRHSDSPKDKITASSSEEPVRVEFALLKVFFDATRDNVQDVKDRLAQRAEFQQLSASTAFSKSDAPTDQAYA